VLVSALSSPGAAAAQGAVSGRISLQERAGETTTDLGNAIVYLDAAPGAKMAPRERSTEIAMHDREYVPHVRVVAAGSSVAFLNQDPFRHNVFSNATAGPFDLGLTDRGGQKSASFKRPGVYPIFCNIHARMAAFVVAVSTPWFAQAGADGRFTIPDVPAGRYTLHAWHERGGEDKRDITVPPEGVTDLAIQLDARGYVALAHKNKFGQEYATETERY
jgi:plastocyanin